MNKLESSELKNTFDNIKDSDTYKELNVKLKEEDIPELPKMEPKIQEKPRYNKAQQEFLNFLEDTSSKPNLSES